MIESLRHRTPPERRRTFQEELEDLESIVAGLATSKGSTSVVRKEESNSKARAAGVRRQLFSNESSMSWSPAPPCPAAGRAEELSSRQSYASVAFADPCAAASSEKHAAEGDSRAEQLKTVFPSAERRKSIQHHERALRTSPSGRRVTFPPAEKEAHVVQNRAFHEPRLSRSSSPARVRCMEQNSCIQATEHDVGTAAKAGGSAIPLWQGASTGSNGIYLSAALPPQQHSGDHRLGAGQSQLLQRPLRDTVIAPRDSSRTIAPRDSSRRLLHAMALAQSGNVTLRDLRQQCVMQLKVNMLETVPKRQHPGQFLRCGGKAKWKWMVSLAGKQQSISGRCPLHSGGQPVLQLSVPACGDQILAGRHHQCRSAQLDLKQKPVACGCMLVSRKVRVPSAAETCQSNGRSLPFLEDGGAVQVWDTNPATSLGRGSCAWYFEFLDAT
eukprot:CAMPEP_0172715926 /NCGR_PEP_ID=MMETSP1074-20121228/67820_1 /TAXON_ID=2916 /ORGANISM="Ceratium fusus, Strain PA161109" /LENGTH=440 /DNA_ID=CAMNT_0013540551 /DNA_START=264 /DNA_END=1588 /DNA_ORIENTATION=+